MGHKEGANGASGQNSSSTRSVAVICDAIVRAIADGRYPRGARLPTNPEIQQTWKVSARVSRRVLARLTEEGWAISEGTRGYTSTGGRPGAAVPALHPGNTVTADSLITQPLMPRPVHTVAIGAAIAEPLSAIHLISATYEPAPLDAANALRMDGPGLSVMVRRRLITDPAGNIPLELRTSYTPEVPADNPLAGGAVLPGTWTDNLAAYTPHRPATGTSHIRIRPAGQYEAFALHLSPRAYVLMRATTTHAADGTAIDHTVSVWPETTAIHVDRHLLT